MQIHEPILLGRSAPPQGQTQYEKARNVLTNIYDHKINELQMERHRLFLVLEFLQENDPGTAINFAEADGQYKVNLTYNDLLRPFLDDLMAGKEVQPISKTLKAKLKRAVKKFTNTK